MSEITNRNVTSDDDLWMNSMASFVCGVLIVPIGLVGITGNLLTIYVLTRPCMANSPFNVLLTGLVVIDCLMLMVSTPSFALLAFYDFGNEKFRDVARLFARFGYPVATMARTASVWCMLVISLESYLSVCCELSARLIRNPKRAKIALIVVSVTAVTYNFCRFFEYETSVDGNLCPLLKKNAAYLHFYVHWSYFFLIFFLPLLAFALFNGLTVKEIKKRQNVLEGAGVQNGEKETVFTMISVVILFFLCNCLAFTLNVIESNQSPLCYMAEDCVNKLSFEEMAAMLENHDECLDQSLFLFIVDFSNVLVQLNSSVHFVIYLMFCKRFRQKFWKIFRCKRRKRKSRLGKQFLTPKFHLIGVHNSTI